MTKVFQQYTEERGEEGDPGVEGRGERERERERLVGLGAISSDK
jgi:hypothetical protein